MPKKGPKKVTRKIEEIIVQAVLTVTDDAGRLISRVNLDPVQLFRSSTPDVWANMDARLKNTLDAAKKAETEEKK